MGFPPGQDEGAPLGLLFESPTFSGYLATPQPPLFTGVGTPIPIDVLDDALAEQVYGHVPGEAEVLIKLGGRYRVEYVCAGQNGNNARSAAGWFLSFDRNDGAGWNLQNGTLGFTYHRNAATGFSQGGNLFKGRLPGGTRVRFEGFRVAGTGILTPTPGANKLAITRLSA